MGNKKRYQLKLFCTTILLLHTALLFAQQKREEHYISKVWVADNGDGTYKNPVINADYSDPDVIRVGDDYYMIASSFDAVPGLPILHSKDLVNWSIIGHALVRQPPFDHFSQTQHGNGVWAPAIRYHNKEFYIYYPDPDFGIYLTKAKTITGPWSDPVLVQAGKGLIDPCPLWDNDGSVYLVHAYAGSRAGIKSILVVKKMNREGDKIMDTGRIVFDGHASDPTVEGPKFYKRNNYYYIFAPAGGVSTGWQLVLRSKNIYGPYERKVVMDKGNTAINGPHQGAWVTTNTKEDWFLHFQDKGAYGRVVHLQPIKWINDWPVIGSDEDNDGKGEPVLKYKKPNVGRSSYPIITPQESDEFNTTTLGLQWQWQANPGNDWYNLTGTDLHLPALFMDSTKNYWEVPGILLQKFPADEFVATAKFTFRPNTDDEKAGLVIMGSDYACLSLVKKAGSIYIQYSTCKQADKGAKETPQLIEAADGNTVYFKVRIRKGAVCQFSYSYDNEKFVNVTEKFTAKPGRWIGAKLGLFCTGTVKTGTPGTVDIDWFRIEKE